MAKVLVGCPTWEGKEYILEEYADAVKKMGHNDFDVLLIDNSEGDEYAKKIEEAGLPVQRCPRKENARESLIDSRNMLRDHALQNGYDYFFSLEQDVIPQPETLTQLLLHGKSYVTTVVMNLKVVQGKRVQVPMVSVPWEEHPGKLRYVRMADLKKGSLIEVQQAHLACTLISKEILEKFPFRYEENMFDDTCLSQDLQKAKIPMFCDTTLRPKHMPDGKWKGLKRSS